MPVTLTGGFESQPFWKRVRAGMLEQLRARHKEDWEIFLSPHVDSDNPEGGEVDGGSLKVDGEAKRVDMGVPESWAGDPDWVEDRNGVEETDQAAWLILELLAGEWE